MQQVKLSNGKVATSFIADDNSPLAIVHLSVLKFLARLLPSASIEEIINEFVIKLSVTQASKELTVDMYVQMLKAEVAFHESINLIKEYDPKKDAEEMQKILDEVVTIELTGYSNGTHPTINFTYNDRPFSAILNKEYNNGDGDSTPMGKYEVKKTVLEQYLTTLDAPYLDVDAMKLTEISYAAAEEIPAGKGWANAS